MSYKNVLFALCLGGLFFTACDQKTEKVDQEVLNESDNPASEEKAKEQESTKIEFTEREFDFGKINKGEMVSHTFSFKNTGEAPLIIMDAKASCGCTVPQWTKDPVSPGETGEIEVKYNGSGSGKIHKTVTVLANTKPENTVLEIMADVRAIDMNDKGPLKQ